LASSEWHIEQDGSKHSIKEDVEGKLVGPLEACVAPLYRHAQEGLHRCRDIEMAMSGLETQGSSLEATQGSGGGTTCFPIVAGRRHKIGGHRHRTNTASNSSSSNGGDGGGGKGNGERRGSVDRGPSWDHGASSIGGDLYATSSSPSVVQFPESMKVCKKQQQYTTTMT
jgi:hypothetical protein